MTATTITIKNRKAIILPPNETVEYLNTSAGYGIDPIKAIYNRVKAIKKRKSHRYHFIRIFHLCNEFAICYKIFHTGMLVIKKEEVVK